MNGTTENRTSLKQKLAHELKRLVLISLYLFAFFGVFKLYKMLLLDEYHVPMLACGFIAVQSIVLAKVILTADALRLGERFHERPLVVLVLYQSIIFCAFAWTFHVLEHFVIGTARGKTPGEVLTEFVEKGWPHMVGSTMVVFVAFLPFFAFRQMERVLGHGQVRKMFLSGNTTKG
jgi:hypothetical protein